MRFNLVQVKHGVIGRFWNMQSGKKVTRQRERIKTNSIKSGLGSEAKPVTLRKGKGQMPKKRKGVCIG